MAEYISPDPSTHQKSKRTNDTGTAVPSKLPRQCAETTSASTSHNKTETLTFGGHNWHEELDNDFDFGLSRADKREENVRTVCTITSGDIGCLQQQFCLTSYEPESIANRTDDSGHIFGSDREELCSISTPDTFDPHSRDPENYDATERVPLENSEIDCSHEDDEMNYDSFIHEKSVQFEDLMRPDYGYVDDGEVNDDTEGTNLNDTTDTEPGHGCEQPVYANAAISLNTSMLLVLTFVMRYNLTGEAFCDLLTLISAHCLTQPATFKSVNSFLKQFRTLSVLKAPLVLHYYCPSCHSYLQNKDMINCGFCNLDLDGIGKKQYFIELPIASQLQSLFGRRGFYNSLQGRFNRCKQEPNNIEDIYDGTEYLRHFGQGGFLSHRNNISFTWNTDGVPVFKSSKFAIWPLYLIINELPYKERTHNDNMILAGLWFGSSKPDMYSFMKPLHSSITTLSRSGVEVNLPESEQSICVKAMLLAGTCDMPAKCLVQNFMQYNGKYGCPKCKQPGKTVKISARGHVHAFPFSTENPSGPKRTHNDTLFNAREAIEKGAHKDGVKGPSWLSQIPYYDIIKGTSVDYMHNICQGVGKLMLNLWFDSRHKGQDFYIGKRVAEVDKRLLNIKPSNDITRCPRSLEQKKYWKASEVRAWILYYSLPCLLGILQDDYFEHYELLCSSLYILLSDSISQQQLEYAERSLFKFVMLFSEYYGEQFMTCNIHLLVHLADVVRDLGPLWTTSCFHFEDKNGKLLKLFHGTQHVETQIINAVCIQQEIPELGRKIRTSNTLAATLYEKMTKNSPVSPRLKIDLGNNVFAVGFTRMCKLTRNEFQALVKAINSVPYSDTVRVFYRCLIGTQLIHSRSYLRVEQRNSYTVKYMEGNVSSFGQVNFFFQYRSNDIQCSCDLSMPCHCQRNVQNFAMIYKLQPITSPHTLLNSVHIHPVKLNSGVMVVTPINRIKRKCIFMKPDDGTVGYIGIFPNIVEKD